ncbi:adenosine deaminase [Vibrio parahaemolyticus]
MCQTKKKSSKKDQKKPINGDNKNVNTTRRKIEDILEQREFDKLFDL